MKIEEIEELWELAKIIHEERMNVCYGNYYPYHREKFPETSKNYTHCTQPWIDIALAQAKKAKEFIKNDVK